MADLEDSVVVVVEVEACFEDNGDGEVVMLAAMEFMIRSMIETAFSVVPSFTFGRGIVSQLCVKKPKIECIIPRPQFY
ncbi:unnamed protein product [Acanthoscelides obtectus]|uniref:Uncharacterized protein n=1 Tax=Acanthoscelides obtectus TaxID=200917 RepID=A0A9P0KU69_ACAOB|nr:unnamed protein product [Acanthoscelides obtectus]CAK1643383.1 hypothetical protein AOBTE_LOCUS13513 [Acanthoscelides obtectus]